MLAEWLTEHTIRLCERVDDWRQAVSLSAGPLLERKVIEPGYVEAILRQHRQLGPYYVLAPGIAMPHARPEEGAKALGLSLLVIQEGVTFGSEDNDPVYLVVMLAAPDSHGHITMIAQLAAFFSDEQAVRRVCRAASVQEIQAILSHY